MNQVSIKILEALCENGELKLSDIALILPKKFNDHKDFYPFVALVTQGMVEDSMFSSDSVLLNPDYLNYKNQALTWKLFACASAGKKATYKDLHWSIHGDDERLSDQIFTLTGNGYLYLDKIESEKRNKIFTVLIAIFSAVLASALTFYISTV